MKSCETPWGIRDMQIKTTIWCTTHLLELVKFKRLKILNVGDNAEHLELSYSTSWKTEWHSHFGNRSVTDFNIHILPDSTIPLLNFYLREKQTTMCSWEDEWINIYCNIVLNCHKLEKPKMPNCLLYKLVGGYHTIKYYSEIQMNEIFIEKYYPSGEKPNTKDYVKLIKFIWKSKKGKSVITESRLAVSWVVGGVVVEDWLQNGTKKHSEWRNLMYSLIIVMAAYVQLPKLKKLPVKLVFW